MAIINWNSVPDYDEWGIDTSWNCMDWVTYHKKLAEHFGKPTATEIWNYAYAQSGSLSSNLDCRTFNTDFRKYVKENNLSPYQGAGIYTPILQGYGTASDIVVGAIDTTGDVTAGVFDTISSVLGKDGLKKTLSIALIVGGIIGVAYVYKAFKK